MTKKEIKLKNNKSEKRLNELAKDPSLRKIKSKQLSKIDFNNLLVIVKAHTKDKVVMEFKHRGFNWTSLNKLESLGFLWIKKEADGSIIEFKVHDDTRELLIHYIEDKALDTGELETI